MKYVVGFLIVGFSVSLFLNQKLYFDFQKEEREARQAEQKLNDLTSQLQRTQWQSQNQIQAEQNFIQELNSRLSEKQKERSSLQDQLNRIRNQSNTGQKNIDLQFDLRHQNEIVQSIQQQITALELEKTQVGRDLKDTNEEVNAQKTNDEASLDLQIQQQEQALSDLQGKYNSFKSQRYDMTAQGEAKDLKPQIDQQKAFIQKLKAQKKVDSAGFDQQKIKSRKELQAHLQQLNSQQAQLRAQLNNERGTQQQINQNINQEKNMGQAERQNTLKLQSKIRNLDDEIKDISAQISDHQKKLQMISSNHG